MDSANPDLFDGSMAVLYNIDDLDVLFPVEWARGPNQTGSRFPGSRV